MLLILLAYLGGVLTIVSPCILPVLPFVFSRTGEPFARSGLPLLAGMALSFTLVASLAAVGGGWVVAANQYGRWLALALMAVFALALLWPGLSERLARPLVAAGARLSQRAHADGRPRPGGSFLLGIATGLLWAPCAGPILGLILAGAALQGASTASTLMLLAYAAGAATSMAAALLLGGKVFAALKRSLGTGEWLRRGLGGAMLVAVVAITLGLDTGLLARLSLASTGGIEQKLLDRLAGRQEAPMAMDGGPSMMMMQGPAMAPAPDAGPAMMATGSAMRMAGPGGAGAAPLPDEGKAPALDGATQWLNSAPLTAGQLRGKVVLVDFWTYSCINCLRALPYVKAWEQKYRDQGLVVVGVHAPEFAFERDIGNVTRAMKDLGITYPVAVDNQYAIWRAFRNQYWPAHYLIDAQGRLRHHHFGEGNYGETERVVQQLLQEAGAARVAPGLIEVNAQGVQQAADMDAVRSHETYVGYARSENFASTPKTARDQATTYAAPAQPALNAWGLDGRWNVGSEHATLAGASGRIVYRFQARDLHLVLGPGPDGRPVRFRVRIDGQPPGASRGMDVAEDGSGTVTGQRLYQLVRQTGEITPRTFSIEFLDPAVSAYAFTFG
ncbi:cytochrome c biogenesis protein DipZ [Paracidovorax anthurii]|uniref:Cytochrome c biogenesis protein CcdA n=1 Tax=Paracidovorax anthurii TaxID=78229 RepID=A0A328Z9A3_9BURK|nr:cytochrome c biogenesis protein DipZ [Paracidovorax anthurii]RAR82628.1 cytochrome c biogenesis protein CcdA [Paracidovorax anthurii]